MDPRSQAAQRARVILAIADAVTRAIDRGELQNGVRLPTHRALAEALDVDVTTVTRAYTEMQRRGLAHARVGHGTFVLARLPTLRRRPGSRHLTDSSSIYRITSRRVLRPCPVLRDLADDVARELDSGVLLGRQIDIGMTSHRAAGASYLAVAGCRSRQATISSSAPALSMAWSLRSQR